MDPKTGIPRYQIEPSLRTANGDRGAAATAPVVNGGGHSENGTRSDSSAFNVGQYKAEVFDREFSERLYRSTVFLLSRPHATRAHSR